MRALDLENPFLVEIDDEDLTGSEPLWWVQLKDTADWEAEACAMPQSKTPVPGDIEAIVRQQNKRAAVRGLPATLDPKWWRKWCKAWDGACAYCGSKERWMCVEHVIPVSRGGGTTPWNCLPACEQCNANKAGKDPWRWLAPLWELLVPDIQRALKKMEAQ